MEGKLLDIVGIPESTYEVKNPLTKYQAEGVDLIVRSLARFAGTISRCDPTLVSSPGALLV